LPEINSIMKMAIGAAAVAVVVIIGVNLWPQGPIVGDPPASSTSISTPSPSAASPAVYPPTVHGWPGTTRNPAGRYSWATGTGDRLRHNGYSDDHAGSVIIVFSASANAYESGPTAVTVAGYNGTYQELPISADGVRTQLWIVDIEDTRVTITVEAQPDATAAQLAEAHAIIESIRREPMGAGFGLSFTLSSDDWDSG